MVSACIAPTQTLLNNRYQIVRILEDGPWSISWLAEDTQLPSQRQCIIRQVKPLIADAYIQKQLCDRLQAEINTWQKLGGIHDQIPWLASFIDTTGQMYLIEEWVPGLTLTQVIQEQGTMAEDTVQQILTQLLTLVDYLHKNQVVHCTLEPNHVVLREEDQKPVLQYGGLLDQVIAHTFLENPIQPMPWIATSGFLPHEQVILDHPYYSSNLYSLGLIGIYLLTGKTPYDLFDLNAGTGDWPQEEFAEASAFAAILHKAIARFPGERFLTARQMLKAVTAPEQFVQQSLLAHSTLMAQMGAYFNSCLLSVNSSEPSLNSYSG